jgi:hypothetical protein
MKREDGREETSQKQKRRRINGRGLLFKEFARSWRAYQQNITVCDRCPIP